MSAKQYFGIYQGVVSDIKDPEQRGRIKIICPEVLGATIESAWCDPCVPVAYDNGGDFCIPHIDETVWVMFVNGNSNKPVYLGGWWQKNKTPLGSNYASAKDVRIISYGGCKIVLEKDTISINVNDGENELTISEGVVTIQGDLKVKGSISAENDIKAGNVSLQNHTHDMGESDTSKPN